MKQRGTSSTDDIRPEYDLTNLLKEGVPGKYAREYTAGSNFVLLRPETQSAIKTGRKDVTVRRGRKPR